MKPFGRWLLASALALAAPAPRSAAQSADDPADQPADQPAAQPPPADQPPPQPAPQPAEYHPLVRPLSFNIGGEMSIPVGPTANRFDIGWGFTLGATFSPSRFWGIQGEYQFSYYGVRPGLLGLDGLSGYHYLHYFDLNFVGRPVTSDRFEIYVLAGPGLYYRRVAITQVTGVAVVPYCDPYLFICYNTAVPAESVIAARDAWGFGVDAGVGVAFGLVSTARLYLEARYHYVFGPEFTNAAGQSQRADGQYLPLVLGVKF